MAPVRADAADDGRKVNDDVGPDGIEQARDLRLARQVAFSPARRDRIAASPLAQRGEDVAADETRPARDEHALLRQIERDHGFPTPSFVST